MSASISVEDALKLFPELSPDRYVYDDAARLLSMLCPDSIKNNTETTLGSPESFACLLYKNPELFGRVQDAHATGHFDGLWEAFLRNDRPKRADSRGLKKIPSILSEISVKLPDLVDGRIKTPFWTLTQDLSEDTLLTVKKFNLQTLTEQKKAPSMLFYDIGSFKNHPSLNERVEKLFCKGQNTFLVNASATGKTRLLYEGLFQHWGFYITAHADDLEAKALQVAASDSFIGESGDMVSLTFSEDVVGYQSLLNGNLKCLERRFVVVLLVHLLVFREFLKMAHAKSAIDNEDLRQRWLLAQLWYPSLCEGDDIYYELLYSLTWVPLSLVVAELDKVIEDIKPLLPELVVKEGLFVAIDEANAASQQLWWSHGEQHPPIRSIVRTWRDRLAALGCRITFIVAGTKISPEVFPSTSPEWSSWRWTSNTGSFSDREAQKNYILPFLPPSYAETPSGQALFERIWNWCRPRHRLTTVIIRMLVGDKFAHPHGVLDCYIRRLTSYTPSDAARFITEEGPCKNLAFFACIGPLVQGNLYARSATHEVVFHYIVTGEHPPYFGISRLELVTSGVGQFIDADMQAIAMDQPGPTIAAAIWLGNDMDSINKDDQDLRSLRLFKPFTFFLSQPWPNEDRYSPTGYISLYLAHAFVDDRALLDVFSIPTPQWLGSISTPAQLVILRKDENDVIKEMIVGPSALLPHSPPLGYRASTSDDVIAWLKQERTGAFCLCPSSCWADLIFVLKLNGKYVWVVLRTAIPETQLHTEDICQEFEHLGEQGFFSRMTDNDESSAYCDRLPGVLKALPNALAPPGSFPMLRVLASFPTEPSLPLDVSQDISGGPVGTLKVETFQEITEAYSSDALIEGLISSMHGKRSSYTEDMFFSIKIDSNPRSAKRKDMAKTTAATRSLKQLPTDTSSSEATSTSDRPMRPIPRHKTSSSPKVGATVPSSLAREAGKAVTPTTLASTPKRARKGSRSQTLDSLPPVSLRRSPREHKALARD